MAIDKARIAKNTFFLYSRMLILMGISLFTVKIVLKALGAVDYGIYNVVGGVANAGKETVQDFREGAYTTDELKQKKQAKFDKEWKRKEENYKYLMKNAKNIQSAKEAKAFINDEQTQKYLDHGITDIGIIYNARTMAQDKGWSDEQAIARAQIAQGRGKNLKNNDSAQNALEKRLMSENSAITSDMAKNWVKEITKIADV